MSMLKGLWKKIANYVGTEAKKQLIAVSGIEKEEADIITVPAKIVTILMQAADDGTTVDISFGSRILIYKTAIALDVDTDSQGAGGSEPSSEYLRQRKYLLIKTIDPLEGNDKLRAVSSATLQFPQGNKFNGFHVRLIEDMSGGVDENGVDRPSLFKLEFPDTLFREAQRRAAARFGVPENAMVRLTIEREAGVTFQAPLFNLGAGGLNFQQPDNFAPLTENSHLKIILDWPPENRLTVPGTLVKNRAASGKNYCHVRFSVENFEMSRMLGELVTHVERSELKGKVTDSSPRGESKKKP